jgi:hypothetical protein
MSIITIKFHLKNEGSKLKCKILVCISSEIILNIQTVVMHFVNSCGLNQFAFKWHSFKSGNFRFGRTHIMNKCWHWVFFLWHRRKTYRVIGNPCLWIVSIRIPLSRKVAHHQGQHWPESLWWGERGFSQGEVLGNWFFLNIKSISQILSVERHHALLILSCSASLNSFLLWKRL